MSTKTLRKRIALVAVSALTAGLFSVVSAPVANATAGTAIQRQDIAIAEPAANTNALSIGQCAIDATARLAAAIDINNNPIVSTGTVLAVGAIVQFDTATRGSGNLTVTGPATLSLGAGAPNTSTISQDSKGVGFQVLAANVARLTVTGVGDIVVTASTGATIGAGTAVKTFGITGVASCANSDAVNVANSSLTIQSALDQNKGTTGDDTLTGAQRSYGVEQYIAVVLANAYKGNLSTNVLLTAEATNGALVGIDATPATSTAFLATTAAANGNVDVRVLQDTVKAPGAPVTTTVTVKANGVTIGSKTLTMLGAPARIVVDQADVTVGQSGSTGSFKYSVVDAAGNWLNTNEGLTPAFASITAAASGWEAATGSVVTSATATTPEITTTGTKGTGTFACVASATGSSGTVDITIGGAFRQGVGLVKSNVFKATCGTNAVRSWSASMDKATYSPGEIATLTISAKDRNGGVVADTTAIGTAFNQISIPGMTIIGAAITSADVFTSGAKTYKFRVDQAEGNFVGQVGVSTDGAVAAEALVKTIQFSIKQSGGTVTNAEVLKSIVSLIASINKQIQALQKLILRR
jgi:trimeric autotransporter adhesin